MERHIKTQVYQKLAISNPLFQALGKDILIIRPIYIDKK